MLKIRYVIMLLLLASSTFVLKAQEDVLMLGLRAGHNASLGGFAAISIETRQRFDCDFQIEGGVQYNTIGRTALEARPAYVWDFSWGKLAGEVLMAYTNMGTVNSISAGAGLDIQGRWIEGKAGYYYRTYGIKSSMVKEPLNIYYELNVNFLPMTDEWDLLFSITNNEIFELERHYQPSFILQSAYYPRRNIGISLGIGCKPAGMFNMSADYYQTFLKTGICYRW
jgi:hypothetical protein